MFEGPELLPPACVIFERLVGSEDCLGGQEKMGNAWGVS